MMRAPLRLLALALLAGLAGAPLAGDPPSAEDYPWRTDLSAATAAAASSGKPLMIVFR